MGLGSCQHPVTCPVEGVGTFLSDASTRPGCACLPPSLQCTHAWLPGRPVSPEAATLFLCCTSNGPWRGKPSVISPALLPQPPPPIAFCKEQSLYEDPYGPSNTQYWDFAHGGGLRDPLPAALGCYPTESPSGNPSCSRHPDTQLGVQQRSGHQTALGHAMEGPRRTAPG